jgi:hypothetical protein
MKLVRPITVLDAVLTTSNVVETALPAAYVAGTTYAAAVSVSVTTGTVIACYTSLQPGNIGRTPASSPLWWQLSGTTYASYVGGTTYALGDAATSANSGWSASPSSS